MELTFNSNNTSLGKRRYTVKQMSDAESTANVDIYWDNDMHETYIWHEFRTNGRTAQIAMETLVAALSVLYISKPFKIIRYTNHYHECSQPEKLMQLILDKVKQIQDDES